MNGVMSLLILLIIGLIIWLSVRSARRRLQLWQRWAVARNWQLTETWDALAGRFSGGPFGKGGDPNVRRVYSGRFDGVPVMGFHYDYQTGSGDSNTKHYYHVLAVQVPGARFPRLDMALENWATKTFGRDQQFEDADFNRMWFVRSESSRFAHDVCHPRAIEYLKSAMPPFAHLWFENDCLLISRSGNDFEPGMVDTYLRTLTDFVRLLPPFLLKEVGSGRLPLDRTGPGISQEEQLRRLAQLEAQDKQS